MSNTVAVLGAGMVGVSCALELQRRGFQVTLVERRAPGQETSYGNAGVIARSSLIPFNHPGLWANLPGLLRNQSPQFRYSPSFLLRHLGWATAFLARARPGPFEETARALDGLIRLSMAEHLRLLTKVGERHRLRDNGWLFLYRSQAAYEAGAAGRAVFERYGVRTQTLDAADLQALEPGFTPGLFPRTLWVQDTSSVDSPGAVTEAYARWFVAQGGRLLSQPVQALARRAEGTGWQLSLGDGGQLQSDRVVVALGPWSAGFLQAQLGVRVPMAYERGYHRHFQPQDGATLGRPVYDTGGAYVLSPMAQGLRLTSGVELTDLDAPRQPLQLALAEDAARQAFPLGARLEAEPWMGSRPTLPDSRPMIGEAPGQPGLWLAFGHQHIGFSTGPGTAALLGALMAGETPAIDAAPFRPGRFWR
ncbi:FAD-binding oxidoreductase [Curvibacter sp. HBC61]|uniref:FAD-binding oxidoreductase n=1 Tax=Curvibacter cyanobacteriorum TaxID=3026422 RepID=A0ABT5N2Y4_9BURK|nr:FAD-binding oxidoreductase [Curvibacter sp. HBC61]MDD0840388.1 FAD-binding oxidoreductase [Curvibacter sp. HBC61]